MFHMLDMRPGQPAYMEQLARAFEALRQAVTCLQLEYEASPLAIRNIANMPYPLLNSVRQVPLSATASEWRPSSCQHIVNGMILGMLWHGM